MGDYLIVGVHSGEEILKHKGPTIMTDEERFVALAACKWVDEVVQNAPYVTSLELLEKYNIDYCVHGDDISIAADGTNTYQEVKDAGKFRECKRTIGVSTTDLVNRMLSMTKTHHKKEIDTNKASEFVHSAPLTGLRNPFTTNKRIIQFSSNKEPKPTDKVIYVDGGFDLFHAGHIELFKAAKSMGDYLLVGVHDDHTINSIKGSNFPLMNLNERVLSVLSCRYVDEVIIGAPYTVTKELLEKIYPISAVVSGIHSSVSEHGLDPYELPKKLGIWRQVETSFSYLTTTVIMNRVFSEREKFEERNRKKEEKDRFLIK